MSTRLVENMAQTLHLLWLLFLCVTPTWTSRVERKMKNFVLDVSPKWGQTDCAAPAETLASLCFKLRRGCSPSWNTKGNLEGSDWWCVCRKEQENQLACPLVFSAFFFVPYAIVFLFFVFLIKAFDLTEPFSQNSGTTPNCYLWSVCQSLWWSSHCFRTWPFLLV